MGDCILTDCLFFQLHQFGTQIMNYLGNKTLDSTETTLMTHQLPPLMYGYDALEPHIDARTMKLHHDVHHAGYVEKLNEDLVEFQEFRYRSVYWLLTNLNNLPK
jgi:Iron/manganese superoxide dismutases, alpha-hairpin domain